ncbi:aspartyl-phosphate phosphatase Spo0E family protein [Propionispora hippei]|uniref:Spo0E like sporulation regulatory protein n=1 Tax=Propionispora hippei DSM 15287 TaxID=1123003 RepID=A0A1M6P254_9FIRM|nr:aspartyl-phosphate phosphatase Spo0E family protein [Propionispora hippei]SHK02087.1 Spo0E like sporulation regulatory protein [Propionispora hippei DSM 15287]
MSSLREIENKIQELRAQLYEIARGREFTDPEVIKASQKLDQVLNEYEKFFKRKMSEK